MQRKIISTASAMRVILFLVVACLLIGSSLVALHSVMVHADMNSQRITLNTQAVSLLQQAQVVQATDTQQQLQLSIGLQLRHDTDIDSFLAELYNPRSPQYQHYLTSEQFNALFAPTSEQVQQVTNYLQDQGLTVTNVSPNHLLIDVTGPVAQVQKAFRVQINNYRLGERTFFANASAPSIPASLSSLIASITGLDNSMQYHPLYRLPGSTASSHASTHYTKEDDVIKTGWSPKDLMDAYNATALRSAGMLGDNQTVALFELDGYQQNDVTQYFQKYGLGTPNISKVLVTNYSGAAGQGALEVELDIEIIAGIAPHANQIVYEGPNTFQGINATYNKIVTDNKAQVVSISWGLCEAASGLSELQTLDNIFKQGAAQGMTFVAATGDSGAYDCQDTNLAVDSPASDPYVLGVGATNLQLNAGAYKSESVWADPTQSLRGPKGAGSGGGLSNTFKQPAWQSGPGTQNKYTNGYREVPDVVAAGDPNQGYSVYCTVTNAGCAPTGWTTVGGTSAASPLWASSLVLVNQYLQSQNVKRIGYVNPALYHLFNTAQTYPSFRDVTLGNNLYYAATAGYDLASGIGSPNVYNIARDFAAPLSSGSSTPTASPTFSPTPTPTPSPTSTPIPTPSPTPISSSNLIQNGNFETGQGSPWQESSVQGNDLVDSANPHTGQYEAYFCGYAGCSDVLSQTFTVPTNFKKLTVTYWWYADTNKSDNTCLDTFNSRMQLGGTVIINLQYNCNTDASDTWIQETFDISAVMSSYKGRQVTLVFQGTNAKGQYQTSDFFMDDVVMTAI